MRRWVIVATVAILAAAIAWPLGFTVVPIDGEGAGAADGAFDAETYVEEHWDEITTTISEEPVDLAAVLGAVEPDERGFAAKEDLVAIAEEYGSITVGEAHVYMVRSTGSVTAVNAEGSRGTIEIALDGYDGPTAVHVYIGPRIPSDETSIRDAVGFISFGDFREQTEYGMVGAEINRRVVSDVLAPIEAESLEGQTISFLGAMTIRTFNLSNIDMRRVNVVPTAIEVGG